MSAHGKHRDRGFAMFETLITLFVISIWLVSAVGVQSVSLKLNMGAQFRNEAVLLATEIGERMEANKTAAVLGQYTYTGSAVTAGKDCTAASCTPTELVQFDLAEWSTRVTSSLPHATATITPDAIANPINYTIVVSWDDRRGTQQYASTGANERLSYTSTKTAFDSTN